MNASPLPAVPEVFGVRLPPQSDCLVNVDFNLIPNKPPPDLTYLDLEEFEVTDSEEEEEEQEQEEQEEQEEDEDEVMEPPPVPAPLPVREEAPFPISAIATPSDVDMFGTPAAVPATQAADEGSDAGEEEDGLFAGGDDEEEESDGMEEVQTAPLSGEVKRKLVEEDDYD